MSTELMTHFLDGLHASRLLENERVEQIQQRPEWPQGDLDGVARFLEGEGWLTRYQVDEIRQGRGEGLQFAGYRLLERLLDGPCGEQFKAYHPGLQQTVVVAWVNPQWLPASDDVGSYIDRARAACGVSHPHLVNLIDAGFVGHTAYTACEFVDGATLTALVADMGAIPVQLACEYLRQAATAVQAAHQHGVCHGEISPSRLLLTPITRKRSAGGAGPTAVRPAPGAVVRLEGLGLSPRRPPAGDVSMSDARLLGEVNFLPPERLTSSQVDARGDIYGLGAALYYLLTARPPITGAIAAEVLQQSPHQVPVRVDALRRDVNAGLADLIERMLAKNPEARPNSAASVVQYLAALSRAPAPVAQPAEVAYAFPLEEEAEPLPLATSARTALVHANHEPLVEALPAGTRDSQVYSPVSLAAHPDEAHDMFTESAHESAPSPLKQRPKPSKRGWLWLVLGLALHLSAMTAVVLAYVYELGPFAPSSSSSTTEPAKIEKSNHKKAPKQSAHETEH
jgi:eukaryotic-like serine/threonine-protein kinase